MKKVKHLKKRQVKTLKKASHSEPVYDHKWRKISEEFRSRNTYCKKCWQSGKLTTSVTSVLHVDHILPIKERPDLQYDESNFQVLCLSCHTEKTLAENENCLGGPKEDKWFWSKDQNP